MLSSSVSPAETRLTPEKQSTDGFRPSGKCAYPQNPSAALHGGGFPCMGVVKERVDRQVGLCGFSLD